MHCTIPPSSPAFLFMAAFVGLTAYAAVSDIRGFRIPNAVSLALTGLFPAWYILLTPPVSLAAHLAAAGACFAVFFAFYLLGWFGAGDVKLITAIMLWAGPEAGPQFVFIMAIAGGLFAAFLLLLGNAIRAKVHHAASAPPWARRGIYPYGVPIFTAALLASPSIFNAGACIPAH